MSADRPPVHRASAVLAAAPPVVGGCAEPPQRNNSSSLRRALRVLDAVSGYQGQSAGITLTSLASCLGMSKSTVLRLIAPLRDEGLVHQDRDSGRYRLGPAAARLGMAFLDRVDLGLLAGDLLRDLARRGGESVALVLPGSEAASGRTAGAKVLQAGGGAGDRVRDHIAATIREVGWWVEPEDGPTGRGTVAAPVFDHRSQVVAALQAGLPGRMQPHGPEHGALAVAVRDCAATLSERLGAPLRSPAAAQRTTS